MVAWLNKRDTPPEAKPPVVHQFEPGSRWLHLWFDTIPHSDLIALAIQIESVGVRISAAPYVMLTPSEARKAWSVLTKLDHVKQDDTHISISLD